MYAHISINISLCSICIYVKLITGSYWCLQLESTTTRTILAPPLLTCNAHSNSDTLVPTIHLLKCAIPRCMHRGFRTATLHSCGKQSYHCNVLISSMLRASVAPFQCRVCPPYGYSTRGWSTHLLMDSWLASAFWLLQMRLPGTFLYRFFGEWGRQILRLPLMTLPFHFEQVGPVNMASCYSWDQVTLSGNRRPCGEKDLITWSLKSRGFGGLPWWSSG